MTARILSRRAGSQTTAAPLFSLPPHQPAAHSPAFQNILVTRCSPRWKLTICAFAVLGALAQPVWADGGAGGSGIGGTGGAGGANTATGTGDNGGDGNGLIGGGGGGGGGAGEIGGAGGNGSGDGGDGGEGGGHRAIVISSGNNSINLTGSDGGLGGNGANGGGGGGGGAGGYGVVINGSNLSYTNSGIISGGAGGAGGSGSTAGHHGSGGVGISGSDLTLTNSGTISGGLGGDGITQADALQFTDGINTLTLETGWHLNGNIAIQSGTLTFDHSTDQTVANTITGGGTLILYSAGSLELTGANTYTGETWIDDGVLKLSGAGSIAHSSKVFICNCGTFDISDTNSGATIQSLEGVDDSKVVLGSKTLTLSNASDTFSGIIQGTGGLAINGGREVLEGVNTYTGGTTFNGGTLVVQTDESLGASSGGLTFNGGALEAITGFTSSRAITLTGAGTIQTDTGSGSSTLTLNGLISGPGSLTSAGAGKLVLNHANTYTGGTNVYGDVDVAVSGALGTGPVVVQGGVSDPEPMLTFAGGSSALGLTIHNAAGGGTVFDGTSTADHAILSNGAQGHTIFAGHSSAGQAQIANHANGATVLADQADAGNATITNYTSGRLLIADQATAGGAMVMNNTGGTVDISHVTAGTSIGFLSGAGGVSLGGRKLTLGALNGNDTIAGVIADGGDAGGTGGSLVKAGSGMLILNGINTYTGGTTVNAGTLKVGDAATPTARILGDVQVNTAGTLRGHGSIGGNVINTGIVWPGGSIGTLTVGGNYTQASDATLQIEISPTTASQLKVGGTASLAGTLSLLYGPGTYTSKNYAILSANAINGKFSTVTGNNPSGVQHDIVYGAQAVGLDITAQVVAPTDATIFGAAGSSLLREGQRINDALLDRLAGSCIAAAGEGRGAGSATETMGSSNSAGVATGASQAATCARQGNGLWIQAQGANTRIDGNQGAPDVRDQHYGFLAGSDHNWHGWALGVAGGYSHADITESGNGARARIDTLRIAGYGARNVGAVTLAATLGYAYDFLSTTRSFGALGAARGSGHGQELNAGLQASHAWQVGSVTLTPRVGLRYAYLNGLGLDESGPTAQNLGVGKQSLQSLQPYIGLTLDYPFSLRNSERQASIQLRAGYAYETQGRGRTVSVTAADGTGFAITGTRDTRGMLTAGLGATLPIGKSTNAYVRYDAWLHTGNVSAQSLQAGVDYRF